MKNAGKKKLLPLPVRAARVLKKLKHVRGLSAAEKSVHALGLAATPQERWEIFERNLRLSSCCGPLKPSKSSTR